MDARDRSLERWYRRLLASYPRPYREQRGDELVAVLIEGARDGQRLPSARDAIDLVVHGLGTRMRRRSVVPAATSNARTPGDSYGDALAAASVRGLGPAAVGSWLIPSWLRWLRWLPVLAGVIVIVAGVRYVFFDRALAGYSGSASATGSVEQTTYHGVPVRPIGNAVTTLNLRSVSPRIVANTADATVTVLVCTGQASAAPLAYGGTHQGDAAQYCAELADFHPGTLRLGSSTTDPQTTTGVLLAVTAHRAGVVRIEGDVSYRQGIRYGHQHVGSDWSLRVR
jgi:hypothetical protein